MPPRSRPPRSSADEGFSFVELLVALSLLLITIIAVMGLAMTSSFMANTARQRSAMVNAAAGYLERVRQESYNSIGTAGGDPNGDLASSVTTSAPYTITVTPTVTWGRPEEPTNHQYKTVTLSVGSYMAGGGSQMTYSTSAVFADTGAIGSAAVGATVPKPTAAIVSPANGSFVWGTLPVSVAATAGTPASPLAFLDVIDGVQSWGAVAISGTGATGVWNWNTSGGREGAHLLFPRVTDSAGNVSDGPTSTLTVDNSAPGVPGAPGSSFVTGTGGSAWWTAATDGTDVDGVTPLAASHYVVSVFLQPSSTTFASDYTKWTAVTSLTGLSVVAAPSSGSPMALPGLAGFSRYCVAVKSSSADRGASPGLQSAAATTVGITRSTAAGTWTVTSSSGKYTVSVKINIPSGPTFPWTGTASTQVYRLTSRDQVITTGVKVGSPISSSSPTWNTATVTDSPWTSKSGTPTSLWYAAVTTLTPNGYLGASTTVQSCVVASPANTTLTGGLVFAKW